MNTERLSPGWESPHRAVRLPGDLEGLDGLVIPGGESTTIGRLAERFGLLDPLRSALAEGLPTLATCAGMILVAASVVEGDQPLVGGLDVVVRRNAFGRQNESFEMDLDVRGLDRPFHGVFIRAPWVEKVGAEVEVLARVGDRPVMVSSGGIVAALLPSGVDGRLSNPPTVDGRRREVEDRGRPLQMGEHQAPQGAGQDAAPREALCQAGPGHRDRGAQGRRRSRRQLCAGGGGLEGQGGFHAQRQHPPGDQAGDRGERRGGLRRVVV